MDVNESKVLTKPLCIGAEGGQWAFVEQDRGVGRNLSMFSFIAHTN